MSGVTKVFPSRAGGTSPAAGPSSSSSGSGGGGGSVSLGPLGRVGKREAMIGGAGLVAVLALVARARAGGDASSGGEDGPDGEGAYELDTRYTDLYNDLQPELENIAGAVRDVPKAVIAGLPKPAAPKPPKKPPKPKKPKPKPKPKKPGGKKPPKKKPPKKKPPRKPPRR